MDLDERMAQSYASARAAAAARAALAAPAARAVAVQRTSSSESVEVAPGWHLGGDQARQRLSAQPRDGGTRQEPPTVEQLHDLHDRGVPLCPEWRALLVRGCGSTGGQLPERRTPQEQPAAAETHGVAPQRSNRPFDRFKQWAPTHGDPVQQQRARAPPSGFDEQLLELMGDDEESGRSGAPAVNDTREASLRAVAASKLLPMIPEEQYPIILGTSAAGLAFDSPTVVRQDVVDHLHRVAHRQLDKMRCGLNMFALWLQIKRGRRPEQVFDGEVGGSLVVAFLEDVARVAKAKAAKGNREDKGHAAPNRYHDLLAAARLLGFPFDFDAAVVTTWRRGNKVSKTDAEPAPTPSIAHVLFLHVALEAALERRDDVTAGSIAGWLAQMYSTLREILASRSSLDRAVGELVCGRTGIDFKKPKGSAGHEGRPLLAPRYGADGSDGWWRTYDRLRPRVSAGETPYIMRDNNSSDGNPYQATRWGAPGGSGERPMPRKRQMVGLHAVLTTPVRLGGVLCPPPLPIAGALKLTLHSLKRVMPATVAVAYPANIGLVVEPGAWAGSALTAMTQEAAVAAASGVPTGLRYGRDGVTASCASVIVVAARLIADYAAERRRTGAAVPTDAAGSYRDLAAYRGSDACARLGRPDGPASSRCIVVAHAVPTRAAAPAPVAPPPALAPSLLAPSALPPALAPAPLALLPPLPALRAPSEPEVGAAVQGLRPTTGGTALERPEPASLGDDLGPVKTGTAHPSGWEVSRAPHGPRLPLAAALPAALRSPPRSPALGDRQCGTHGTNLGYVWVSRSGDPGTTEDV